MPDPRAAAAGPTPPPRPPASPAAEAPKPPPRPPASATAEAHAPADYEDALFGTGSGHRSKHPRAAVPKKRARWPWVVLIALLLSAAGLIAIFGWQRPPPAYRFLEARLPPSVQDALLRAGRAIGAPPPPVTEEPAPAEPIAEQPATTAESEAADEAPKSATDAGADAALTDAALPSGAFNQQAAKPILQKTADEVSTKCKEEGGPTGTGKAMITFAPNGRATQVTLPKKFAMTKVGECVAAHFMRAKVPRFEGKPRIVSKYFTIQ